MAEALSNTNSVPLLAGRFSNEFMEENRMFGV